MDAGVAGKTAPPVQSGEPGKGARTRERLLDLAYEAMIVKGLGATSVDELVEAAGITKSGFFYHFRDKNDLARQVVARYRTANDAQLDALSRRARELSEEPLQSFLIFLRLYAEAITAEIEAAPGCLVATVAFQERAFAHDVRQANVETVDGWRTRFRDWLCEAVQSARPNAAVDVELLADAGWSAIFGAFTLAKTGRPASVVASQVLLYRDVVRRAFAEGISLPS
ncbi:TetR/AcrR family transcriptional regulator [Phenylobacterium sp.]|jgi:TetR/AcrR family transcriptional repressor of nem operon|uniref:TetR/AcrR family transcriptional regulator n=1 Tax=Phenylobacterium sp. TaxID=1871053 RepID=UPI0037846FED